MFRRDFCLIAAAGITGLGCRAYAQAKLEIQL